MESVQWKRMMFKNRKVYAQMAGDGKLLIRNGLVVIKYQLDQNQEYLSQASLVKEIDEIRLGKTKNKTKEKKEISSEKKSFSSLPFENQENDVVSVFTDGACGGNPGPAGIGIALQYRNHTKKISRFIGWRTNNIAELTAIKVALQEIKNPNLPVILYTDSSYCHGVLSEGWKPKKNQQLIKEIKKEMNRFFRLRLIKIKGHHGIEGNELANQLAQKAIRKKTET